MKNIPQPLSNQKMNELQKAEKLFTAGNLEAASALYLELTNSTILAPVAYYRLASIANVMQDTEVAKNLYYKAFELKSGLCSSILPKVHPNHKYVFPGRKNEESAKGCPLCGKAGAPYWCYCLMECGDAYVQIYNPVRVWMQCDVCHHLYAEEFPKQEVISTEHSQMDFNGMPTQPRLFPTYSEQLNRITQFTSPPGGSTLLEVGIGGSECALVASEMGFDVFGIDISKGNVAQARKYGLDVEVIDFIQFETDRKWDIIIMGDVIEHVSDPVAAMKKAAGLLADDGVIWLSTPNFESAFAKFAGHNDPMRREASHKNYFSRNSLFKLLEIHGLMPVEYRVSAHYNGSMEVIAVRDK